MEKSERKTEETPSPKTHLFGGRSVLGDGLRAFRNSVLGQFTRKDETDRGLDLAGRDGALLVVGSKLGSLSSDTLEDIYNLETR